MDVIKRNFFNLLRSGALNRYDSIEPMSAYKWNHLYLMLKAQGMLHIAAKGVKNHQYDTGMNMPAALVTKITDADVTLDNGTETACLSNHLLNRRLKKIQDNERHVIDASIDTLRLLNIIVNNVSAMLNKGISLRGIINLGTYLRKDGGHVDFVKLDNWLSTLHLRRMAQLQGSFLISAFNFEQDEIPFITRVEPSAQRLIIRAVGNIATDAAKEWHFRQSRSGFVRNNSAVLRRNLRRSIRFAPYATIETVSNFINNFARSMSEIEE